jgi:uncharacterized damage-inducible protein DinB
MLAHFQHLLAYETWANARTLDSLRSIPQQHHSTPEAQRAMGLLAHNALARQIWLWRINAVPHTNPADWFPLWSGEQLQATLADVDGQWKTFLTSLRDADLARELHYTASDGTPYTSTIADVCEHVFNHSTYHRGQIARIVHLLGGTRASTDLIAFTRKPR